jgi:PAS domain S-box-containing protein
MDSFNEVFKLAAKHFYKEFKNNGGTQEELAEKLKITKTYLSSVINSSRSPSIPLMKQIAFVLSEKPLDEFLVVGRRLKNGSSPTQEEETDSGEGPESLIAKLTYYIVDHQRIEKQLDEKQWLLEQALDMADYGVIIVSKERKGLAYNTLYKEIFGYPEEILATRNIETYVKWSRNIMLDKEEFDRGIKETLGLKEPITHIVKLKNGKRVERKINPIMKDGNFAGWIAQLYDITPKKKKRATKAR